MKDTSTSVTAVKGSRVELPCVASAFPLPQYSWAKEGAGLAVADNQKMSRFGGNLVLEDISLDSSGEYTCVAENSLGRRSLVVRLTVTGR